MTKKTASTSASKIEFSSILTQLGKLQDRRRTWEDGLKRAAESELYEILGQCFEIYRILLPSSSLKQKLTQALTETNHTVTAGSSLQLKVVRYVFGGCSEEHTYARAIKAAETHKPENVSFAEWLSGQGGPSGIKKTGASAKPKLPASVSIAIAASHFEKATSLVSVPAVPDLAASAQADHSYSVALVRPSAKDPKQLEIVFGTNRGGVVNRVLEAAASTLSEAAKAAARVPDDVDLADVIKLKPQRAASDRKNGASA